MKKSGDLSESPPLHKGNKAIVLDYDFIKDLPDGTDKCLYCLTGQQVQILIGMLPYIGWETRWASAIGTTIDTDKIQAWEADLAGALMADNCQQIQDDLSTILDKLNTIIDKENEIHTEITTLQTDLDVSQSAQDVALAAIMTELTGTIMPAIALLATAVAGIAGQTTSILSEVTETGADVDNIEAVITDSTNGLVEVSQDVDNIELLVQKLKIQVNNTYNYNQQTVVNVNNYITFASSALDTTDTSQYARYNALCSAIVQWLYTETYAVLTALDGSPTDLASLATQIDAQLFSLQVMMSTGVYTYTPSVIYAAVSDTTAVNDIACYMLGKLTPLSMTYDNFSTAINGYSPPAYPDNRAVLKEVVTEALVFLDAYATFTQMLAVEQQRQLAANPTTWVCPECLTVGSLGVVNFSLGQKFPWLIQVGQLVLGKGVVSVSTWNNSIGGYREYTTMSCPLPGTLSFRHIKVTVTDTGDTKGHSGTNRQITLGYTVSGVRTASALSMSGVGTQVLDWDMGALKTPTLIDISSNPYIQEHYIVSIEFSL